MPFGSRRSSRQAWRRPFLPALAIVAALTAFAWPGSGQQADAQPRYQVYVAGLAADVAATGPSLTPASTQQPPPTQAPGRAIAAVQAPQPAAPPASLRLPAYYTKYLDAGGIPVIASAAVSDAALLRAREIVDAIFEPLPSLRAEMVANGARVALLGLGEVITGIPEYANLYEAFPGTDWNATRSLGGTATRPVAVAPEENVLCLPSDTHAGQGLLVHELAHLVDALGGKALTGGGAGFDAHLARLYAQAGSEGRLAGLYAGTDQREYWAEGAESWFDANPDLAAGDGIHGSVNTRAELRDSDPALASLLTATFGENPWRYGCP